MAVFEGAMVALVTPFKDGEVDYDALRRLVDLQIAGGIDAIVPCGTTGESPTLSHAEHNKVIDVVVEQAAGRVPVIAGTGSNSTAEAIQLTRHAKQAGADAALMVSPYYNKPTQAGLYEHFRTVAEAVDIPIVLYNIPGRCGVNIQPQTIARLAEIPNIVAVKEATGSLEQACEIMRLCEITILSGDDALTLPLMSIGGRGVISVIANIVPGEVKKLTASALAGDFTTARQQHKKLFPLSSAMLKLATNPIPIKAALSMIGMIEDELRLPLVPLSQKHRPKLAEMLKSFGLKVNQ